MLAALVGVGVWLVGGVEQAARGLLCVVLAVRACGWAEASSGLRQSGPGAGGCCFEPTRGSRVMVGDVARWQGGDLP